MERSTETSFWTFAFSEVELSVDLLRTFYIPLDMESLTRAPEEKLLCLQGMHEASARHVVERSVVARQCCTTVLQSASQVLRNTHRYGIPLALYLFSRDPRRSGPSRISMGMVF